MPVCGMKYEGYRVTMQISTQNMDWIIEIVRTKDQDRFVDENYYWEKGSTWQTSGLKCT